MFNSYDDIKREYEYLRQADYLRYDEKRNQIYAENPKLRTLDLDIIKAYINIGTTRLSKKPTDKAEAELNRLKTERSNYLKEHGIRDDYNELKYVCDKCKDTGYVDGHKCSCFVQKVIELFDNVSHFSQYIKEDNFDNLDLSYYNQSGISINGITYKQYMQDYITEFKNMVTNMDEESFSLLLIGATGTGKTFLARCMGALALKNNKSVLYVNVNEYLNSLKPDYEGEPLKYHAISCDLFILDDLGTERVTDYTNTEINYIIDKRLNDKKSTIITTNLVPDQIEEIYLGPTHSRLENSFYNCYLAGDDLRRLKNANI